ncbi:hypothetical protein AMES_5321 [Amycolatopsis mediterranei S699]|uniref:Uncharacterized protein n=1 Tax=Amycolatopsis mediterranei (strain U-32) TaxID=749927 RepID=A0A0H3D926_AMYMU|nr:hypothetical protein AMED_5386 [Amycolatopsis mediterranei U32]AFO78857.1 hypothetical protein AMES_5321 [Amycolatopsis mediterranei S699]AGT85985.1 hypothetical protein B737_5321 [Amycolatopsis mediterranei RB]KDO04507.1 hypothetical protein DV26_43580 [Amycolatopsis mediterranei]KDU85521.1 hypothetical protein DV36_45510 [Amycolatopsis mediterranei]
MVEVDHAPGDRVGRRDLDVFRIRRRAESGQVVAAPNPVRTREAWRPDGLARLQRTAGNEAVAAMVRGASEARHQPAAVQRYEAFEHATEGDRTPGSRTATAGESDDLLYPHPGVRLTSGEIDALADMYGSPDDLFSASPDEIRAVVALVHRQQARPGSVQESEWDAATGGRYTRLNLRNAAHFGPSNSALVPVPAGASPSSVDNRENFRRYYSETIINASEAFHHLGLPSAEHTQRFLSRATISAGFAEHYLLDAFSAGHLFNKEDFTALAQRNLNALPRSQQQALLHRVGHGVLANPGARALLGQYEAVELTFGFLPRPNFDNETAFNTLLERLYDDPDGRQAVLSALVKVVHDRLDHNDAGGGAIGVPVENNLGAWVLSGDKTLATSPQTQQMIERAITEFRTRMQPYFAGPTPPGTGSGYAPGSEEVIAFFPRTTADSTRMIAQLIRDVTNPAGGMANALVSIIIEELPSLLEGLVRHGDIHRA